MEDIANIYTRIGNIQTQINDVTGNTLSNYNQTNLALTQYANIFGAILNSNGSGNLNTGNIITTGNVQCGRISTLSSQLPFRIEYGTTEIVSDSITITFSTPFTVAPTVMITGFINDTDPPSVYIRGISRFTVFMFAKSNAIGNYGNLQFNWIAIGI